jgi:hypothetical protein
MVPRTVNLKISQEERGILDEAKKLLYLDVMLESFALMISLGCEHRSEDEETSVQKVSVEGEPHLTARWVPSTQKTHAHDICALVSKGIASA